MKGWKEKSLWVGTLLCSVAFVVMTVDSLHRMAARTHDDQISPEVVAGKRLWQHYDCNDCHTILGIGGYYAPDVTKAYAVRGDAWLRQFLKDPEAMFPNQRQMPNFRLSDQQIGALVAYLKWVSEVDTNDWPPSPEVAADSQTGAAGIFVSEHCNTCHVLNGNGGKIGPDLTHVGARRSQDWILVQINNPRIHNPNSVMPGFAQLPEQEKQELARYLASLK
jgi:nitric oxide reductase subunit C